MDGGGLGVAWGLRGDLVGVWGMIIIYLVGGLEHEFIVPYIGKNHPS